MEEIGGLMESIVKLKEEKILLDIAIKKKRNALDYLSQPVSFLTREKIKDEDVNLEKFVKIRNSVSKMIEELRVRDRQYLVKAKKDLKSIVESRKSKKIKIENLRLKEELEGINRFMRNLKRDIKHDIEDIEVYYSFLCDQNTRFEKLKEKHLIIDFYINSLKTGYKEESLLLNDSQSDLKRTFLSSSQNANQRRDLAYKSKISKHNKELIHKVKKNLKKREINLKRISKK